MKKIFTFLILLGCFCTVHAQQSPQYSLYMLNKYGMNPAYGGLDNSLSFTGVIRKQWVNLEGSPFTQQLNAHMPLYLLRGGVGINIENDILGATRNTSATLSYNYWIPVNKTSLFSVGISAGVVQRTLDGTKLRAPDGTYDETTGVNNHNDNRIPIGLETAIAPTVTGGVYFQSKRLDLGFSAINLLENDLSFKHSEGQTDILQKRHFMLFAATNFEIGSLIEVMPSALLKSDISQNQVELSTIIRYNGNVFGGASIRGYDNVTLDAVVFIAGMKINDKTTLAYSYDLTLSDLNTVSDGSHEITINYNLNKSIGGGVPPPIIYNPRFL